MIHNLEPREAAVHGSGMRAAFLLRPGRFFAALLAAGLTLSGCASPDDAGKPCGMVSAYLEPARAEGLYRTVVTNLDGRSVISQPNYQLLPGRHTFTLVELIDAPQLDVPLSLRVAKTLTIEVKPNTRYHLAAHYLPDGDGKNFWQPVVWQQDAITCHFPQTSGMPL